MHVYVLKGEIELVDDKKGRQGGKSRDSRMVYSHWRTWLPTPPVR